ncbi:uncharacterized protein [Cardiocondyla obscurior]|uniref:uncharacterized protein n=1 Tax=Cardiocondyla obscurior TaxID=286306 RepID=UPI00396566C0
MAMLSFSITQINWHHSKSVSAILTRSMAIMQTRIALIQEPWFINNAIKGLGGCGKLYYARSNTKPITCILVKGLNAVLVSQASDRDQTVILIGPCNIDDRTREMYIKSVYMPYNSQKPPPQESVSKLVELARIERCAVLLGCDANFYYLSSGSTDINLWRENLHLFIVNSELIILNRGNDFTFMDLKRHKVIDITLCTKGVLGLVRNSRILSKSLGSDYRSICNTLQAETEATLRRNSRQTRWEDYRTELIAQVTRIPNRFNIKNNLDEAAQILVEVITKAYENNCPERLKSGKTRVPWWNQKLGKLRSTARRLFNKAKSTGQAAH